MRMIGLYLPKLLATFKSSPSTSIDASTKLFSSTSYLHFSITSSNVLEELINSDRDWETLI